MVMLKSNEEVTISDQIEELKPSTTSSAESLLEHGSAKEKADGPRGEQASKRIGHPTRFQKIGEMTCLFLSWYQNGKFPICNFGPSRAGCCFMLFFAVFVFGYFVFMIETFR